MESMAQTLDMDETGIPLVLFLGLVELGTRVHIYLRDYDAMLILNIRSARDILRGCEKTAKKLQHHACVVGFGTKVANDVAILEVVCI